MREGVGMATLSWPSSYRFNTLSFVPRLSSNGAWLASYGRHEIVSAIAHQDRNAYSSEMLA